MGRVILLMPVIALGLTFVGYRLWCALSDWTYDGPRPQRPANTLGRTYTDAHGKLWWRTHDNVGWSGWVPGHLGARIVRRHEMAKREAGIE